MEPKKCQCGKTKNADGNCDGSHAAQTSPAQANGVKAVAFDKITIRCISTGESQKEKFMYPDIANNKRLLKNVGFVISDPNYEAKMEAFKTKKPYLNGATKATATANKNTVTA